MTATPFYNELVLEQKKFDVLPTFEPVVSHEDFLVRHDFVNWLHETLQVSPEQIARQTAYEEVKKAELWPFNA